VPAAAINHERQRLLLIDYLMRVPVYRSDGSAAPLPSLKDGVHRESREHSGEQSASVPPLRGFEHIQRIVVSNRRLTIVVMR